MRGARLRWEHRGDPAAQFDGLQPVYSGERDFIFARAGDCGGDAAREFRAPGAASVSRSFQLVLKHGLDFAAALIGLIALLPFFAPIAVCVWLDSPGPVFFRLRMAGRGG